MDKITDHPKPYSCEDTPPAKRACVRPPEPLLTVDQIRKGDIPGRCQSQRYWRLVQCLNAEDEKVSMAALNTLLDHDKTCPVYLPGIGPTHVSSALLAHTHNSDVTPTGLHYLSQIKKSWDLGALFKDEKDYDALFQTVQTAAALGYEEACDPLAIKQALYRIVLGMDHRFRTTSHFAIEKGFHLFKRPFDEKEDVDFFSKSQAIFDLIDTPLTLAPQLEEADSPATAIKNLAHLLETNQVTHLQLPKSLSLLELEMLAPAFKANMTLESLRIPDTKNLGRRGFDKLLKSLDGHPKLNFLDLEPQILGKIPFLDFLEHLPSLENLSIIAQSQSWRQDNLKFLTEWVGQSSLKKLFITTKPTSPTDASLRLFFTHFHQLLHSTTLKTVVLRDECERSSWALKAPPRWEPLATNRTLESLCLKGASPVADLQLAQLGIALEENETLEELWLPRLKAKPDCAEDLPGFDTFCKGLAQNTRLEVLDLKNWMLSNHDFELLLHALQENKDLKQIHLVGNRIDNDKAKLLADSLPNIKAQVYLGTYPYLEVRNTLNPFNNVFFQ